MANNQNLAPFSWTPTSISPRPGVALGTPIPNCQNIGAGDWIQVMLSYRNTNSSPVVILPDLFAVHILYSPNSDDATPHGDQSTTYGGSASNRRSVFSIDPGWAFQAPWDGQLSIIAGGISNPATCVLDVVVRRGFVPRDYDLQRQMVDRGMVDPAAYAARFGRALPAPRVYAPPVVGTPHLVPSTWLQVPPDTAIDFPDGAVAIVAVDDSGIAANPIALLVSFLGIGQPFNMASGLISPLGPLGQGGACEDGVPANWQNRPPAPVTLNTVTVWSSMGG